MATKLTKTETIKEYIPIKNFDLKVDTKFAQFLDVVSIEKLYQQMCLIDLNKVDNEQYYYVRGVFDTLYALIGVDTPLKRVIDKSLEQHADDRLQTYINSITQALKQAKVTREVTLDSNKERKKKKSVEVSNESTLDVLQHIANLTNKDD